MVSRKSVKVLDRHLAVVEINKLNSSQVYI